VSLAAAVAERVAEKAAQSPARSDVTVVAAWAADTDCVCVVFRSRMVSDPTQILGLVYDLDFHPAEAGPVTDVDAAAYHILAFEIIEPHPYPHVYASGTKAIHWRVMSAREHDRLAVISQLPDVDALMIGSCSSTSAEPQGGQTGLTRVGSSSRANSGLWPLERVLPIIPAGLDGLAVQPYDADMVEPHTVLYVHLGVPGDGAGWIRATRSNASLTLDDVDNDQTIYYQPMFEVSRVAAEVRAEFGEYAYVTRKFDATEVWTLHADTVTIQAGFPRGAVRVEDLWAMARQILHDV